ncbi:hypothetical protein [Scytonema sp. NUACC26]|uniref:hypothetical protein n=1 Tax=Scytonema sp. NUACC26 TaxID=3140176 RepID=UPI0038B3100C
MSAPLVILTRNRDRCIGVIQTQPVKVTPVSRSPEQSVPNLEPVALSSLHL